jgi:hypothetical protein
MLWPGLPGRTQRKHNNTSIIVEICHSARLRRWCYLAMILMRSKLSVGVSRFLLHQKSSSKTKFWITSRQGDVWRWWAKHGDWELYMIYIWYNIIHNIYICMSQHRIGPNWPTEPRSFPPSRGLLNRCFQDKQQLEAAEVALQAFWHSEVVKTILAGYPVEWGKLRTSWIWVVQSVAYIYIHIYIHIYMYIDTNTQLYTNICRI